MATPRRSRPRRSRSSGTRALLRVTAAVLCLTAAEAQAASEAWGAWCPRGPVVTDVAKKEVCLAMCMRAEGSVAGWPEGAGFRVHDAENKQVAAGALKAGSEGMEVLCVRDGCYTVTVHHGTGGPTPGLSWRLLDEHGAVPAEEVLCVDATPAGLVAMAAEKDGAQKPPAPLIVEAGREAGAVAAAEVAAVGGGGAVVAPSGGRGRAGASNNDLLRAQAAGLGSGSDFGDEMPSYWFAASIGSFLGCLLGGLEAHMRRRQGPSETERLDAEYGEHGIDVRSHGESGTPSKPGWMGGRRGQYEQVEERRSHIGPGLTAATF